MKIGILTISDTRNPMSDSSGDSIAAALKEQTFLTIKAIERKLVIDDKEAILSALSNWPCDVIISTGGTGVARRDITIEAVQSLIETEIPGFGELFRQLSFAEIGSHALASRALAFFDGADRLVFVLPGSPNACQLAMQELILPELDHLIKERRK